MPVRFGAFSAFAVVSFAVVSAVTVTACSSSSSTADGNAPDGGTTAKSDGGSEPGDDTRPCSAQRKQVTCAQFPVGPKVDPGKDLTPQGFPAPPAGSQLCGSTLGTNFYLSALSDTELFAHYRPKLEAQGYKVAAPKIYGVQGCPKTMEFESSDGTKFGNVSWIDDVQAFQISFP